MTGTAVAPPAAPLFEGVGSAGRWLASALVALEYAAALVLAVDVAVVFASVIWRYFLLHPLNWAEEVARALMVMLVFFGAASALGRRRHAGLEPLRGLLPSRWQPAAIHLAAWIVSAVSAILFASSIALLVDTEGQTTPFGMPAWIFIYPVVFGSGMMVAFGLANAVDGPRATVFRTFGAAVAIALAMSGWNLLLPDAAPSPFALLVGGFVTSLVLGVPIAFVLAFSSALYFLAEPTLPIAVYAQQLTAGTDHFVLLAVPFFVLAGLAMEINGMSARLIELLLRLFGRARGGLNLIIIVATAFFSGISGSKLADIAAVGGIVIPAVRRAREDPNEAAGLLATSAIMAETIPPCVNMIIFGFVANVSIGGLFVAGLVPAAVLAAGLAAVAVAVGRRIDPATAFPERTPMPRLIGGALVALVMVALIGRGVTSGMATATEVSSFAVIYAIVVGGLAFRQLTAASIGRLFVRSASMSAQILFIVAAASGFSYALTIQQIPQYLSDGLITLGQRHGADLFVVVAALLMTAFGSILEGAPALIIWGPLLTPIATSLGVSALHFGTVMVIAMGLGLFSPPFGLGLFATCAMTGTEVRHVAGPMLKYLSVLVAGLVLLILVPSFSLWLPTLFGYK
jgi:tripartite ATP-independent transporter DctM subunit